ncbi:MAG: HAD family hydrolase, partial [Planctomycetota bacterium]
MIDFHKLEDDPESLMRECDELYSDLLPKLVRPMPRVVDWLSALKASGHPFALTTSSRRKWVEIIFAEVDWDASFEFILTGDDVSEGKPDPEMYLSAATKFAVEPSQMLVLEDSGNGCAAGVAAGAVVVAVPNVHTVKQDFTGALFIADSLGDPRLLELIDRSS